MSIVAIVIAVILGFLVLKLIAGVVKFVILAVIVFAVIAFLSGKFG
jgi:hypothetical protein